MPLPFSWGGGEGCPCFWFKEKPTSKTPLRDSMFVLLVFVGVCVCVFSVGVSPNFCQTHRSLSPGAEHGSIPRLGGPWAKPGLDDAGLTHRSMRPDPCEEKPIAAKADRLWPLLIC